MKIYTLTCNNAYNYGAVLQAYALQTYLSSYGNDVEIINYIPPYLRKISDKYKKIFLLSFVRKILYFPDYYKSKIVFNKFKKNYLKETAEVHSLEDIRKLDSKALYIVGSDQVWNPYLKNGWDETYYLNGLKISKLAYAASFGVEIKDSKFESFLKTNLSSFDWIGIRERKSCEFLSKLGIPSSFVVDPVYLLNQEEWERLCVKEFKERYVLVYALHHIQEIYDYARSLANKLDAKVYVVSVELKEMRRGNDRFFWNASVEDFVSLIKNSLGVVSNSFHGISFGLIFKKPLHIFDTESNDLRLSNIVDCFGLENRIVKRGLLLENNIDCICQNLISANISNSKQLLIAQLKKYG